MLKIIMEIVFLEQQPMFVYLPKNLFMLPMREIVEGLELLELLLQNLKSKHLVGIISHNLMNKNKEYLKLEAQSTKKGELTII